MPEKLKKPPRPGRFPPVESDMLATTETTSRTTPTVVLALPESPFAAQVYRLLRQAGGPVQRPAPGSDPTAALGRARRAVVVVSADPAGESGWLICAKLRRTRPDVRVVLLAHEPSDEERRLALFVGATALVCETDGPAALVEAVYKATA
jgi:DNA-binding NarL/FixJ family response regulator